MKRRDLLKGLGVVGLGSLISLPKSVKAAGGSAKTDGVCWLTTALTEGPYYFNPNLFRPDIRTDSGTGDFHDGIRLDMTFSVIDANCNPIPNAFVDAWHCDKDGLYSGYVQPGGNTVGQDFMRGTQVTDANGQCTFTTSYPGWYSGRATHIHFKVRLNAFTYVTSQFAFPEAITEAVYNTPLYSGRGQNTTNNSNDGIFRNQDLTHLMIDLTENTATGGYDGLFTVGIDAPTGLRDNSGQPEGFQLNQNYPNPFNPSTTIAYTLPEATAVDLRVYDALGQEVAVLVNGRQTTGDHRVRFDALNLESGFYFYRIKAGAFAQVKEMVLIK